MVADCHDADRHSPPPADAVRRALQRVLLSEAFRGAPQLSTFLTYIVERSLEGRAAEIKGYTIAVEALGRGADFDPQIDPIVRVEAGRLRRALRQYYQGEGAAEPLRISIPVGTYQPVFETVFTGAGLTASPGAAIKAAAGGSGEALTPAPRRAAGSIPAGILPWGALVLSLAWLALSWFDLPAALKIETAPPRTQLEKLIEEASRRSASSAVFHLPVVVVRSTPTPDDPVLAAAERDVRRWLIDTLARFDDLVSVRTSDAMADPLKGADYVFEIVARRQGEAVEGLGQLRAVKDGRVVWTTSITSGMEKPGDDPELRETARRLGVRLAEPFGIIHSDFRLVRPTSPMHCVFKALNVRRTLRAEEHLAARDCLVEALERDPAFQPAWAQLALLTIDEHTFGLNRLPGEPLDRALAAALTAVRLAPSSARAQQALMSALFMRGARQEAFQAGRDALERNPYDPDIMADIGSRYVEAGMPEEGSALLQRAVASSSGRPGWYDVFAFLAAHLMGQTKLAETHSALFLADDTPLSLLGRALYLANKHDDGGAVAALRRLARLDPTASVDLGAVLARMGFVPSVVEHILADLGPERLRKAGLHGGT